MLKKILPAFEQQERTLYNEHFKAKYIRDVGWKLVSLANDTTWHLYGISAKCQHWANEHQVFPKPR